MSDGFTQQWIGGSEHLTQREKRILDAMFRGLRGGPCKDRESTEVHPEDGRGFYHRGDRNVKPHRTLNRNALF